MRACASLGYSQQIVPAKMHAPWTMPPSARHCARGSQEPGQLIACGSALRSMGEVLSAGVASSALSSSERNSLHRFLLVVSAAGVPRGEDDTHSR
jgi:hypothetical protein